MNDYVIPCHVPRADDMRQAAAEWDLGGLPARLAVVAGARRLVAARAETLAATVARPIAETIVAEVLPLLEAARFLEREAPGLLAPRSQRGRRPLWLLGVRATLRHERLGAVLILAPGNYPLFLAGAQTLQALTAGNAVALKPAPGGEAAAHALAAILTEAGLPPGLLHVLDPDAGPDAVAAGFDHIVLTGSAATGAAVLAAAARSLTPCTMELSGVDAVYVLPGANLGLVARCLAYGLRLNGGATCIAPRRVFVTRADAASLEDRLAALLPGVPDASPPPAIAARLDALAADALAGGARRIGDTAPGRPTVLAGARADMALLHEDVFAPWLALVAVDDADSGLRDDATCPYALGASIFGPSEAARALAVRVRAGSVCINDVIVPTADPRLPFGGSGRSGFGRTRGAEGLLAMTATKTVSERRGWFRPHLAAPGPKDAARFGGMVRWLHGR